jgi:hypothetical protein
MSRRVLKGRNLLQKQKSIESIIQDKVKPILPKPSIAPPPKKVTWEDLIQENLEPISPKVTKLLGASNVPSLKRIIKVKSYQRIQNGKLINVAGYDRKGVLVSTSQKIDDVGRREKLKRIRKRRETIRIKKEQIELENLRRQQNQTPQQPQIMPQGQPISGVDPRVELNKLWDEDQQRMISFPEYLRRRRLESKQG